METMYERDVQRTEYRMYCRLKGNLAVVGAIQL